MQSIKWWVPKLLCSSPLVSAKTMASIGITNTNYPSQSTIRSFKSCYLSHTQKNIYTICFMQWCSLFALVILRCGCLSAPRSLLPSIHILAHIACVFRIHLDVWYHQIHMDCIHLAIIGIMMSNICMHIACGSRSTHIPSVSFIWTQTMVLHAIPWPLRCFSTPVLSLSWAWSFYLVIGANLRDFIYHYLLSSLLPVVVEPMASFGARHLVSLSPTGCVIVFSSVISLILSIVVRPKLVQARCVPYSMSGCLISLIFDALWYLTGNSYMSYTAKGGVGLLFLNVPCLFSVRSGHTITRPITLYKTTVIAPGDIANFSVMSCIISLFYLCFLRVSIHYVISCLILINFMFCLCIISLFYLHYLCVFSDLFSHIYAVFFLTYLPIFMLCLILINKRRIECYKRRIELYKRRIELYKRRIELYKRRIELYKRRIEL
eukprot:1089168_1